MDASGIGMQLAAFYEDLKNVTTMAISSVRSRCTQPIVTSKASLRTTSRC